MKTYVKVEIPRKPESLIELGNHILQQHEALGDSSPFSSLFDMEAYRTLLEACAEETARSDQMRKEAEAATERRNNLLGFSKHQNTNSSGTLIYMITRFRNVLSGLYRGQEHQMGDFGFNVSTTVGKRQKGEDAEGAEPGED